MGLVNGNPPEADFDNDDSLLLLLGFVVVFVVDVPAAVMVVVATRSHEGHMVRVVAGSCM